VLFRETRIQSGGFIAVPPKKCAPLKGRGEFIKILIKQDFIKIYVYHFGDISHEITGFSPIAYCFYTT
jgi:hypothetical protein